MVMDKVKDSQSQLTKTVIKWTYLLSNHMIFLVVWALAGSAVYVVLI